MGVSTDIHNFPKSMLKWAFNPMLRPSGWEEKRSSISRGGEALPSSGRTSVLDAMRDRIGTPTLIRRDRTASSVASTEGRLSGQSGLQVNEGERRRKTSLESVNHEL